jgi:hypothetical protein
MKTGTSLGALAVALSLAVGIPAIAAAETATHQGHDAAGLEIVLNNGAKWQGDQNMYTGMTAIRGAIAANVEAIHGGTLSADAAREMAGAIQAQLDFMLANCVLEPAVDEQFHVVLAQVTEGVSDLEAGNAQDGALKIVQALNAYGEHFEHPGWQAFD